eukprot:9210899-Ditylum_brightwellii.AAC.1
MATPDEPDDIVDFSNVAPRTNENGGKYKRVEATEIYTRLKISKGRVSCRDLAWREMRIRTRPL